MELKVLRSRVGTGLLGAAVFDDVLVILGLSVLLAVTTEGGGLASAGLVVLRMALFLAAAIAVGVLALPRLVRRVDKLPISQGLVAFVLVTLLLYAWAAEALGSMAAITGAFLAGLFLSRSPLRERIQSSVSVIAYGLFVPIFFISVGLVADAHMLAGQEAQGLIARGAQVQDHDVRRHPLQFVHPGGNPLQRNILDAVGLMRLQHQVTAGTDAAHEQAASRLLGLGEGIIVIAPFAELAGDQPGTAVAAGAVVAAIGRRQAGAQGRLKHGFMGLGLELMAAGQELDAREHGQASLARGRSH